MLGDVGVAVHDKAHAVVEEGLGPGGVDGGVLGLGGLVRIHGLVELGDLPLHGRVGREVVAQPGALGGAGGDLGVQGVEAHVGAADGERVIDVRARDIEHVHEAEVVVVVAAGGDDGIHAAVGGLGQLPVGEPVGPLGVGVGVGVVAAEEDEERTEFTDQAVGVLARGAVVARVAAGHEGEVLGGGGRGAEPHAGADAGAVAHDEVVGGVGLEAGQAREAVGHALRGGGAGGRGARRIGGVVGAVIGRAEMDDRAAAAVLAPADDHGGGGVVPPGEAEVVGRSLEAGRGEAGEKRGPDEGTEGFVHVVWVWV